MSPSVNKLPHLTRLFPHPCIFTLSCQLLNHLFQPKKHKLETFHRRKNPDLAIWVSNLPLVVNSSSNLLSISRIFISKRLKREGEDARMREQSSQVGQFINGWRNFSIFCVLLII